jgi:Sulfotransferase family
MNGQFYLNWRYLKLRRRLINAVCKRLYRDTNKDIRKTIMIAGTGRSGTTWLADIIASQIPCRILFEPFHSTMVSEFHQFNYFQYMRPTEPNDILLSYCRKVFTGDIRNNWIDSKVDHIYHTHRVIKDIRTNLFLKWVHNQFPDLPIIFIIRHPCAVVQSLIELKWDPDKDITQFLSQKNLIDDFLADKIDLIKSLEMPEEKHAVIWCILNLVPTIQFEPSMLNMIFYENLCTSPESEVKKVFQTINYPYRESVFEFMQVPSTTTRHFSAIVTGDDKIARWKKKLSVAQIKRILSIVEKFELGHIYDDSDKPLLKEM